MDYQQRMQKCHLLITEEAVKEALTSDKGSEAQLTSWKIEDFTKKGDNYAAMVTSVKVEFSLGGKEDRVSYVVKMNPCHGMQNLEGLTEMVFLKEVEFYLKLQPQLNSVLEEAGLKPLAMAHGYHGGLEKAKQLIFLEDLRPRGFKMYDRKKGLDTAHATLVVKELAKLHSASMLLQKKNPEYHKDTLLHRGWYNIKEEEGALMPFFQGYVDTAIQMLKKIGGYESSVAWAEGIKPELADIFKKQMEPSKYQVILHGDAWNNNFLFRYNEEGIPVEVMLIDLQICRRESFAVDLNYMFYTSLTGDVRKPNLEAFLEAYRSQFNAVMEAGGGEMLLGKDEVMKEFRNYNKLGAIFSMVIVGPLLMESEDVPDFQPSEEGGAEDMEKLMAELRQKTMDMLDKNPIVRPRFLAAFDELKELGMIST